MLLGSLGNRAAVKKATSAVILLSHRVMMEAGARNVLCFVLLFLVPWSVVRARSDEKGTSIKNNFPTNAFHNKTIITDHHHLEDELRHEMGEVDLDKASEDELEFYYFTVHDFDHNKLLDGLEIMAALHDSLDEHIGNVFTKDEKIKHYIDMTDEVLKEDDLDKDGFLSFVEYMHSQKRTASPTTILDKTAKEKGSKS